jgi:hypothetical protein
MVKNLALALGTFGLAQAAKSGNMNGKYVVASGDKFAVDWNDDYASKGHEYFDVWAPEIATHYGEVFWTDQGNLPIPEAIAKRFEGKVMAITGYEQDQVMVSPVGQPGVNPEQDVSVPINWAYNHHYMAWMTGKHSKLKKSSCCCRRPHGTWCHDQMDRRGSSFRSFTSRPSHSDEPDVFRGQWWRVAQVLPWLPGRLCPAHRVAIHLAHYANADRHAQSRLWSHPCRH